MPSGVFLAHFISEDRLRKGESLKGVCTEKKEMFLPGTKMVCEEKCQMRREKSQQ